MNVLVKAVKLELTEQDSQYDQCKVSILEATIFLLFLLIGSHSFARIRYQTHGKNPTRGQRAHVCSTRRGQRST